MKRRHDRASQGARGIGLKFLFVFVITGAVLAGILYFKGRLASSPAEEEIAKNSEGYIQQLGSRRLDSLSTEEKLLLLHSYYNTHEFVQVVRIGEAMVEELRNLPSDRRNQFSKMVEEAYRQLKEERKAGEFRRKLNL